jgi:hypothetical protein
MADAERGPGGHDWNELAAVLLLSVTAILTAWSGFQASNWGGAMSISFAEASSARIQAARLDADANRRITVQASLFTQWLQAHQADDQKLATFLATRFPEPLATAFPAWLATQPATNPSAPATPFDMKEYAIPETRLSDAADRRADAKFAEALENNQRGDNYTLLTVAFATVLFFAAISGRMRTERAKRLLLALGFVGFVAATAVLVSFPRLV